MTFEYSGCRTSGAPESPVCLLEPGEEVRIWAQAAPGVEIRLETLPRGDPVIGEAKAGGQLFRVDDPKVRRLEIVTTGGGAPATFTLPIEQWTRPEFFSEAREMARSGNFEGARSLLEEHLAGSSEEPWYGLALGLLARLEQRSGRAAEARELLRRAILEHRRRGDISDEIADRCLSIHISFSDLGDFRTALRELEEMPPPPLGDADSAYLQAYYRGTLALYSGDYRNALLLLSTALERRELLADAAGLGVIAQLLARVLQRLGRGEEARDLFDQLTSDVEYVGQLDGCERARLFNNVAWDRLLKLEAGSSADDPLPLLERALKALGEGPSCQTAGWASIHINLGFAFLHRGDLEAARQHLEKAQVDLGNASPRLLLWHLDLESRLQERQGHFEQAQRGYRQLQELAVQALSPEAEWRALFGQARVAEFAGRNQEALEAYDRAEALLDDISLRSPVGLGRATSMIAAEGSTRSYLSFLLDLEQPEEALRVARRSRSRVLRGLVTKERLAGLSSEERLEWSRSLARYEALAAELDSTLSAEWQQAGSHRREGESLRQQQRKELRQSLDQAFALLDSKGLAEEAGSLVVGDGEVVLLFHPVEDGWIGFAVDSSGTKVERLEAVSLESGARGQATKELATGLLGPFRQQLETATQVRILSYGWLRDIDFHALPIGGDLLLSKASVVYGLDLPKTPSRPEVEKGNRALVVVDPTETLPAAARESYTVAGHLRRRGLAVELLERGGANRSRVLSNLEESNVFHFGGHADFGEGLGGSLRLSDEGRLSVSDILTAASVPQSVMLAACETGRAVRGVPGPSLSLAEAFNVAGSREVLSTSRAVDDQAAAAMVVGIYQHWKGDVSLAEALRRAQLEPEIFQGSDWAAFRVLGR